MLILTVREELLSDSECRVKAEYTFSANPILFPIMVLPPPPWQLALARVEGALPFLTAEVADGLALASLRRLWRVHVRDYCERTE